MIPRITLSFLVFLSLSAAQNGRVTALTGARVISSPGRPAESATIVIRDGKIVTVGKAIPKDATVIRVSGKTIIPGLVNAHGHMGAQGTAASSQPGVEEQLALYGRYGVTTVWSLDVHSLNNYTMNVSSILYLQRKMTGWRLISS
ncbi:MAG: hypothetical protein JNL62_11060 [Bryobacterales bacterium]|nr:hypothetical protein [Bryobacterales bacterium]